MHRDKVLQLLRDHRLTLNRFGVKSIALFGSAARDEAGPESDADILVEFERPPSFDEYMDLKFYLEDLLHLPIDLVPSDTLKPRVRPYVQRDAIHVP